MSSLHLIRIGSLAPTCDSGLLAEGDAVVWMEEAVTAVLNGAGAALPATIDQYVVAPDLALRGLAGRPLPPAVRTIDHCELVDLVARHERSVTW